MEERKEDKNPSVKRKKKVKADFEFFVGRVKPKGQTYRFHFRVLLRRPSTDQKPLTDRYLCPKKWRQIMPCGLQFQSGCRFSNKMISSKQKHVLTAYIALETEERACQSTLLRSTAHRLDNPQGCI